MKNLITEAASLIGTSRKEELNGKLKQIINIPLPQPEYQILKAVETANNLLHLYAALRAKLKLMGYDENLADYAEQVFLVASELLVVAAEGFDNKPEKLYLRSNIIQ